MDRVEAWMLVHKRANQESRAQSGAQSGAQSEKTTSEKIIEAAHRRSDVDKVISIGAGFENQDRILQTDGRRSARVKPC